MDKNTTSGKINESQWIMQSQVAYMTTNPIMDVDIYSYFGVLLPIWGVGP